MSDDVYLGNPHLKKANTAIEFTQEQIYEVYAMQRMTLYILPITM